MQAKENWLIVECDLQQKGNINVNGIRYHVATKFNPNYRERQPVLAVVKNGCEEIKENDIIVVHHNFLRERSPFQIEDELFALKYNDNIFVKIDSNGYAHPVCGNITAKKIKKESKWALPVSCQKDYLDRAEIIKGSGYATGEIVFVKPYSCYEIVYVFNGIEHRVIKLHKDDVVANLKFV